MNEHVPGHRPVIVQQRAAVEKLDDSRISVNVQQHPERRPGVDTLHEYAFGLAIQAVVQVTAGVHIEEQHAVEDGVTIAQRFRPKSRLTGQI